MPPRYVIGIDLGTTNCALARSRYGSRRRSCSGSSEHPAARRPGRGSRSARCCRRFSSSPGPNDFPAGSTQPALGPRRRRSSSASCARRRGAENPARLVASAKSWLSHPRRRPHRRHPAAGRGPPRSSQAVAGGGVGRAICGTSRAAWDARSCRDGRCRTGRARDGAGVVRRGGARADAARGRATPGSATCVCSRSRRPRSTRGSRHAAATLARAGSRRRSRCWSCDVGGGTTDFTLIAVSEDAGALALERVAVGDHILLGGDNMDLALARRLQQRLEAGGQRIDAWQLQQLWQQCRAAKEQLFADPARERAGHDPRARLARDRRHAHAPSLTRADLERGARRRLLPDCRCRAIARSGSAASACRSSGCPTPPSRRSPGTWRGSSVSWPAMPRRAACVCGAARAGWLRPRTCCSTAA